jgi:hypothetical protein
MSDNIRNKIDIELDRLLEENVKVVSKAKIQETIAIFKSLDSDLVPLLELIDYAVDNIENEKVSSSILIKLINFYGLGKEVDILKTRQKISMVDNKLTKKPFLKKEQIELINTLLVDSGIL